MAQDSIHKIITIEIEYSKLIKSWAEAQKVIDETRQSIKNLKKEDADYYEKMAQYKAVIRDNTDAQRQYMKQINEQVKKEAQLDGSVNKLRSDISKLAKEYYALSEADRKSAKGRTGPQYANGGEQGRAGFAEFPVQCRQLCKCA